MPLAFVRGGAVADGRRPGWPLGLAARGGWRRHSRGPARRAPGTTCSPAPRTAIDDDGVPRDDARWPVALPVALLVRAGDAAPRVWAPMPVPPSRSSWAASASAMRCRRRRPAGSRTSDRPATPARDYAFVLDDGAPRARPPRARGSRDGVHGAAEAGRPRRFAWTDAALGRRRLDGAVVYELHVGTFTPEGTLDAAIERLDHLVDLGVAHVELMPLADVRRHARLGLRRRRARTRCTRPTAGPRAVPAFVDACHARGLGVSCSTSSTTTSGPSGNHLRAFGPYLTDALPHTVGRGGQPRRRRARDEVRALLVDNALHVAARLPRRRAPPRRRARARRRPRRCRYLRGAGRRGRRARRRRWAGRSR